MIERLLAAEAALARDELDLAERLFGQVAEADPRNAIALVGLGRVAAGRDDAETARARFRSALAIDPEEAAATRLLAALDREAPEAAPAGTTAPPSPMPPLPAPEAAPPPQAAPPPSRSLLARLAAWLRGLGRRG